MRTAAIKRNGDRRKHCNAATALSINAVHIHFYVGAACLCHVQFKQLEQVKTSLSDNDKGCRTVMASQRSNGVAHNYKHS